MYTARIVFRRTPALALTLLLAGCAASFPQETAQSGLVSAAEMQREYNLDTSWWTRYELPALNDSINMALEHNTDLAKAAISVSKALYKANLAESDLLPIFSSSGSASSKRDISSGASSSRSFQGTVDVNYELDLWRRLSLAANAKEWEYKATIEDLASARLALINNVAGTWFQLHYLDQAILMAQEDVARYEKLASLLKFKYEAGKVASVESLQAEQSLLAARNKLTDYQTKRSSAAQTMRDLLNIRPGETFPFGSLDLMSVSSVPVDLNVPVAALSARPDIAAAEHRLHSMFSAMEAQKKAWYPQISVGSALSVSSSSASSFFNVPMLSGLAKISFPFLDWNTLRWNTKLSEADFESAKLSFTSAVTTALNEVDAACTAYANARRILENSIRKAGADARIAAYYRTRFQLGASELKDYLDAQNTANASALTALENKYQALVLENNIYKAMGGRYTPKEASSRN